MKKKKLYIFAIIVVIILYIAFFSKYEKGVEIDRLIGAGTLDSNKN